MKTFVWTRNRVASESNFVSFNCVWWATECETVPDEAVTLRMASIHPPTRVWIQYIKVIEEHPRLASPAFFDALAVNMGTFDAGQLVGPLMRLHRKIGGVWIKDVVDMLVSEFDIDR